jgi:hypothetical protein
VPSVSFAGDAIAVTLAAGVGFVQGAVALEVGHGRAPVCGLVFRAEPADLRHFPGFSDQIGSTLRCRLWGRNAGKLCKVEGCSKPARARRWCSGHYQRWWRTGDPLPQVGPRPTVEQILAECRAAYSAALVATYQPEPGRPGVPLAQP